MAVSIYKDRRPRLGHYAASLNIITADCIPGASAQTEKSQATKHDHGTLSLCVMH
jgi:hypothetical protein